MLGDDVLRRLPKAELHSHLDGGIRIATVLDLAHHAGVALPADSVDGLRMAVFKSQYASLEEYLRGFAYTCAVLHSSAALERVAYEFACDHYDQGVLWLECRFAPQLLAADTLSVPHIMHAVVRGLSRATEEYNAAKRVFPSLQHRFGVIACAMRYVDTSLFPYYARLAHNTPQHDQVFAKASLELAQCCVDLVQGEQLPILALDLAGPEAGYPPAVHAPAFDYARHHGLHCTVHAGESAGSASIVQAVCELHAQRIGHGLSLFDQGVDVADLLKQHDVCVEVCITSNLQTCPALQHTPSHHPLRRMLDHQVHVALCTDNCTFSHTTINRELKLAMSAASLTLEELSQLVLRGFQASFLPNKDHPLPHIEAYIHRILTTSECWQTS